MWRIVWSGAAVDVGKSWGRKLIQANLWPLLWLFAHGKQWQTFCPGLLSYFLYGSYTRSNSVAQCQVPEPCGGKRVHLTVGFPGTQGYILHLPGPSVVHKTGYHRKKGHVSEPTQSHINSHLEILELMVSVNKKVLIIKSNSTLDD